MRIAFSLIAALLVSSCALSEEPKDSFAGTCYPRSSTAQGLQEFDTWKAKIAKVLPAEGSLYSYGGRCVMDDGTEWVSVLMNPTSDFHAFMLHLNQDGALLKTFDGVTGFAGELEAGRPLIVSSGSILLAARVFSDSEEGLDLQFSMFDVRTGTVREATETEKALFPKPWSVF